jgi:dolichol-phosphate mannosyltransferase
MNKKAIVIIPTYNEAENIKKIVPILLKIFTNIKDWKMGILVVDDTSPDGTYKIAEKFAKKYPQVHLLVNKQKSGLGGAYLKGMDFAFNRLKADVIFEFDADLSHDPNKIPDFLKSIDEGVDLVLGSRYIKGGAIPENWGFHRKFLSVFGNIIISVILTNFSIRDWTTGYRAIKKEVYQKVHPLMNSERFRGYTFQIGFLNNALRQGFVVREIPFKFIDRTIGQSKLGPEYIKNTLSYIIRLRIKDLLQSRFFKFLVVGGFGTLVQLISFILMKATIPEDSTIRLQVVNLISIELAILSNFLLNNIWTFADRKLKVIEFPVKFIKFNFASAGSVIIQAIVMWLGLTFIGRLSLFVLPIIPLTIDTPLVFAATGIIIGLFWNFFAYNKFIWKK